MRDAASRTPTRKAFACESTAVSNTLPQQAQHIIRYWHSRGLTPMGRLGTLEDIGNVVALFCSDQASWITGQLIYADGGASLTNPEVPPEIQLN